MTYQLLTYATEGRSRAGICIGDRVYDAAAISGITSWSSSLEVLDNWTQADKIFTSVARELVSDPNRHPSQALDGLRLLAPIPNPGTVYCAGANYADHLAEMARAAGIAQGPNMRELGEAPWHFIKAARSAVVGPDAIISMPKGSTQVDWEIELAVVIGRVAKNIDKSDALQYVAGYTIANDLSARDLAKRKKNPPQSPFYFDWIAHKSFDGSCPLGPWMVPASALPHPGALAMKLWVGDELMQDSNTSGMVFGIEEQLAALSARVTLWPGDIVLTGTPAGVGNGRGRFLRTGETVRMWIEGIGEMQHTMV